MPKSNIKLVWDINQSQVVINNTAIIVVAKNVAPKIISAIVEEQDTALVLGKPTKITLNEDKPSWALANQLESQNELEPGSVVVRDGKTIKLLAIIHDLSQEPSWNSTCIEQALDNIFNVARSYGIKSIQLPILGAEHGRFDIYEFLKLLIKSLKNHESSMEKIWLMIPQEKCAEVLSYLQKN